jgi:hypothetical protein
MHDPVTPGAVVVAYYSRTGTTERVAIDLAEGVPDVRTIEIEPRTERSYPNWLLRSFVPDSTVPIEPVPTDLSDARALFVGTPKWTLSCPPVSAFLEQLTAQDVPVGLFLTYGGFDERRYARRMSDRLERSGATVAARLLVKRDRIDSTTEGDGAGPAYESGLERFRTAVLDAKATME